MKRAELVARTRQLVDEGDRLMRDPSFGALRVWLKLSDDLLSAAWGSMDRYHLAWLMVGKPKRVVRGRPMAPDEELEYVREVAAQKTAALRMSLEAVERRGMPFVGEDGPPEAALSRTPGIAGAGRDAAAAGYPGGSSSRTRRHRSSSSNS